MQPNEITEVLNRPISQELLARGLDPPSLRRQGRHTPVYPDRVRLERRFLADVETGDVREVPLLELTVLENGRTTGTPTNASSSADGAGDQSTATKSSIGR